VKRAFAALVVISSIGCDLFAQQKKTTPGVGDHLVITMTGDLAKEYARRIGSRGQDLPGLEIETTATIAQQFGDGRVRIEHSSPVSRDGKLTRLVTLTGIVDSTKVETTVIPKGTPVYASPGDHKAGTKPNLTPDATTTRRLQLSDLKGLKLRTWTLAEEIGD
jgi:hypothetical protein